MRTDDGEFPEPEQPMNESEPATGKEAGTIVEKAENSVLDPDRPDCSESPAGSPLPLGRLPVVGIGASAGGLEALQAFFSKVPADSGMAFVVITHMRPSRESLLPELLRNVTGIPIVSAGSSIPLEPNTIVVARDTPLTISGGVLLPAEADVENWSSYHPIDYFFRALAADQQEHAIGVILSGSGNDGTLGLKAIKAAGGMVIVQDPSSAKYSGMPESAISTRLADYVLLPDEMPASLVSYSHGPFLQLGQKTERTALADDAIQSILVRLRAHAGRDFTCYKKNTMSRRIERRMNMHHIDDPEIYLRYLRENTHEMDLLQQELLISVTSFFRDPEAFVALAEKGIPRLLSERQDGDTIRVWVAGCATGEEAYSVAILMGEQIRKRERVHDVQVFATDLDERSIEVARSGLYPEGITSDVSPERLQQHFTREDGALRIHKNIRDMVVFAVQNVITDPPFTRMDLIVCRNLLIYLDSAAQQRVLSAFHYALRPGGLLFLGSSEGTGEADKLCETIDSKHKILRRRDTPMLVHPALSLPARVGRAAGSAGPEASVAAMGPHLGRSIERMLLDEFAPCTLVVDDRGTVLYIHGPSGQFFAPEEGQPRNNAVTMAREGLGSPLAAALREVKRQRQEVVRRGIMVRTNGDYLLTDLRVKPISSPTHLRGLFMVALRAAKPVKEPPGQLPEQTAPMDISSRHEIERELQQTRETLQSTIEELETSNEELKSSNEELQSINEELQSTNEELETSKEEMQSLNEELNTVNSELQSKVSALANANDDMNNLLNSMQVATIFLDPEMRVKRYTEQARNVFRLINSDIGRPLSDLTSTLDYSDLIEDSRRVLATLIPKETEVQDTNGRWYMVRLMPYRTAENIIDGVVMTMVDIDRTRRAEGKALLGLDFLEEIVHTIREPLLVLDGNLRVVSANGTFYHVFSIQPKQAEGFQVYTLCNGQWDIPDLRRLLASVSSQNPVATDFRLEHDFPRIGKRAFLLNARRIEGVDLESAFILLAFEEAGAETS